MYNPLMDDSGRLGAYREEHAILHEACAYTLIAVGRASKQTKKVWGEASALMQQGDLDGSFRRAAAAAAWPAAPPGAREAPGKHESY